MTNVYRKNIVHLSGELDHVTLKFSFFSSGYTEQLDGRLVTSLTMHLTFLALGYTAVFPKFKCASMFIVLYTFAISVYNTLVLH